MAMLKNQRVDKKKNSKCPKDKCKQSKNTNKNDGGNKLQWRFFPGHIEGCAHFSTAPATFPEDSTAEPPLLRGCWSRKPPHSEVGQIWGIWGMIPGKNHRFLHELPDVEMPRKLQKDSCYIRNCPPTCDTLLVQTSFPNIVKVWLWFWWFADVRSYPLVN